MTFSAPENLDLRNTVTVLIPVLNGSLYIEEAIRSAIFQKAVTEILVVDNGSSDNTKGIVEELSYQDCRVKLLSCKKKGVARALNYGLFKASGNLIARIDADDIMLKNRISMQLDYFENNSPTVLVASQVIYIDTHGKPYGYSAYPSGSLGLLKNFLFRNPIAHPSVLFRKDVAILAGGYKTEFEGAEDLDLWIRMSQFGKLVVMPEFLTMYRTHPLQISANHNSFTAEKKLRANYLLRPRQNTFAMSLFAVMQIFRLIDLSLSAVPLIKTFRKFSKTFLYK